MIDRLRRHARQKAREIELSVEHETFPDASANLDRTTSAELALAGAIDKLPPDQREAIRMLKLNEMSLKEASHASGRSIAALKVATHRAIRNLRHLLRGQRP
jgi:RNA polymerase sigma-70 factor (ECF subfamily)